MEYESLIWVAGRTGHGTAEAKGRAVTRAPDAAPSDADGASCLRPPKARE